MNKNAEVKKDVVRKKKIGFGAVSAIIVTLFSYVASQFLAAIFIGFWASATGRNIDKVFGQLDTSIGLQFTFFVLVELITLYILWLFLKLRSNSWKDIGLARKPVVKDISPELINVCRQIFVAGQMVLHHLYNCFFVRPAKTYICAIF